MNLIRRGFHCIQVSKRSGLIRIDKGSRFLYFIFSIFGNRVDSTQESILDTISATLCGDSCVQAKHHTTVKLKFNARRCEGGLDDSGLIMINQFVANHPQAQSHRAA